MDTSEEVAKETKKEWPDWWEASRVRGHSKSSRVKVWSTGASTLTSGKTKVKKVYLSLGMTSQLETLVSYLCCDRVGGWGDSVNSMMLRSGWERDWLKATLSRSLSIKRKRGIEWKSARQTRFKKELFFKYEKDLNIFKY